MLVNKNIDFHCLFVLVHIAVTNVKGILHFFLEIGSFYNSPRVKQLSFIIFEYIQTIF